MPAKRVDSIKFEASKVVKRVSKGKSILQFTLSIDLGEGRVLSYRNCILGIGKKGMWCSPSIQKYRADQWSKEFSDSIIKEFQLQGYLKDLDTPEFEEESTVNVTWSE